MSATVGLHSRRKRRRCQSFTAYTVSGPEFKRNLRRIRAVECGIAGKLYIGCATAETSIVEMIRKMRMMLLLQHGFDGGFKGAKCRIVTKFFTFFIFTRSLVASFRSPVSSSGKIGSNFGNGKGAFCAEFAKAIKC